MPAHLCSRRELLRAGIGLAGLGLTAGCGLSPPWQQAPRLPRVGYLARQDWPPARIQGFTNGLADRGYVDGENVVIEWRWAATTAELPALAADLVRAKVDVIVAASTLSIQAAMGATGAIPIVMSASGDPVGMGLVPSLARPVGNVTGLSTLAVGLSAKRMELLKEAIPGLTRMGVLVDPESQDKRKDLEETRAAAAKLGVDARPLEIRGLADVERLPDAISTNRLDALMTLMDGYVIQTATVSLDARIPSMCEARGYTMAGGLMSYGANPLLWYGRAVEYVDKILKGAKPADLPVEQPTDFELVVNQETAQAIGVTFPPSLLTQVREILP